MFFPPEIYIAKGNRKKYSQSYIRQTQNDRYALLTSVLVTGDTVDDHWCSAGHWGGDGVGLPCVVGWVKNVKSDQMILLILVICVNI